MTDRWHKYPFREMPEPIDKLVLLGVDGEVMSGAFNAQRKLWFSGQRPVFPQWWRYMPQLPKERKKT